MDTLYGKWIPMWEQILYFGLWIGSTGYACVTVFKESWNYDVTSNSYFIQGWIPGRWKDNTEFEWSFWTTLARKLWHWYIGYLILTNIFRSSWKLYVMPIYTFLVLHTIFGYQVILLLLAHFAVVYLVALMGSALLVWITSAVLLSLINMKTSLKYLQNIAIQSTADVSRFNLLLLMLSIKNLHYTSFAIELAWHQQKRKRGNQDCEKTTLYSFKDMLYYCTYFPFFFTGPILTYDKFQEQFTKPVIFKKPYLLTQLLRLLFWAVVYDAGLHYFYVSSMQQNTAFMKDVSLWPFAGIAFLVGQLFMVKYVVLYGFPSFFAMIDGFTPPPQPRCVSTIYFYSEMWKYFDCGLYAFIKRYIYVPLGGSRQGLHRQLIGSFICFTFIYLWHGTEKYIFVWSYLNFIGITIESLGRTFFKLPSIHSKLSSVLSPSWRCRFQGIISVPVYAFYMTAIFIFLSGNVSIGMNYAYRLIIEGWPCSTFILFISFLGCVHSSNIITELRQMRQQCGTKKQQ